MTNYELIYKLSKEEMAVFLAQITGDANDYPRYIKDIYEWLDKKAKCWNETVEPEEALKHIANEFFKKEERYKDYVVKKPY